MDDHSGAVLEATALTKHYGRKKVLNACTLRVPRGRVSALVGANGAGKTTLMSLACGLRAPTSGRISVLGRRPGSKGMTEGLAFLTQEKPLYRQFRVDEMLRVARKLNPGFDSDYAEYLVGSADIELKAKLKTLSGGQRTRVALAIALGRRPEFIILDEPLADLDPLARTEVMKTLMTDVAESGTTVLLSSHVISDLENVCDHLVLLANTRVLLCDDVDDLLATHRIAIGAENEPTSRFAAEDVVEVQTGQRQSTVLLKNPPNLQSAPGWEIGRAGLEEIVLSYMRTNYGREVRA